MQAARARETTSRKRAVRTEASALSLLIASANPDAYSSFRYTRHAEPFSFGGGDAHNWRVFIRYRCSVSAMPGARSSKARVPRRTLCLSPRRTRVGAETQMARHNHAIGRWAAAALPARRQSHDVRNPFVDGNQMEHHLFRAGRVTTIHLKLPSHETQGPEVAVMRSSRRQSRNCSYSGIRVPLPRLGLKYARQIHWETGGPLGMRYQASKGAVRAAARRPLAFRGWVV
jgi:hypothetical protein